MYGKGFYAPKVDKYDKKCPGKTSDDGCGCQTTERPCNENDCEPRCITLSACPDCNCDGAVYFSERNNGICPVEKTQDGRNMCANGCRYNPS